MLRFLVMLSLFASKPPEARDQTFDLDEDGTLSVRLDARDDDNDALTFKISKPPKNGEATVAADGKLTYKPKPNFHGKDELSFEVSDGKASVTRKAIFAVSAVNDPPVPGAPVELSGVEDKPVKGQVTASDIDGDELSYSVAEEPPLGSVDVDRRSGKFTFVPKENQNGVVKFTLKVTDNWVDVKLPVTITLAPVNDAPTARDDSVRGNEDTPIKGKLSGADIDGDALTYALGDPPKHGSVEIDAAKGGFVYTGNKDFHGDDGFGFIVSDGKLTAKARIQVEVLPVNDPPSAQNAQVEGNEDTPIKGKLSAKDADGDQVQFSVKIEPKHGDVDIDRDTGAFTFTPDANWFGTDTFTYEAGDIHSSATAVVTVVVKPVNDPPVAADDTAQTDEDKPLTARVRADDVDKDALAFALLKPTRSGVVEVKPDGIFTYTPNADFNGEDAFVFEVTDGKAKAQGTMTLRVRPVNDAPVTSNVKLQTQEEQQVKGVIPGSDVDKDRLTWTVSKPPKKGEVVLDEKTGSLVFVPLPNENGEDTFTVQVSDGSASADSVVTVSIAPVNDAPVAAAHENKGDEDQPIKGKCVGTDVDKDVLSYSLAGKPRFGVVEIDAASGAYTYTPNANYNGEDAFRFEVSDGKLRAQAEVKLTIAPVNDAPEVKNVALSTLEDKAIGGAVPASDIDKDKLTWTLGKAPTKGKAVVEDTTGKVQYTPNQDENGDDTFTVIVSDGKAKTEATVTVAIAPVNDAPVAAAQQNSGNEDTPIKGKLEGSDVDKDTLTYSVVVKPRAGAVELDAASGNYTYTPVANFNGEDGFRFEVSDGKLKSAADVKLTIHAVNDAPEPKDLVLSTLEDREVRGKVIATDVDKDVLTFRLKKAPAKGTAFVDDATGAVRYVPAPDQMEAAAFVVEVTDGFASTDASVKVEITPQPDAPRVDVRAIETAEDEPVTIKLTAYDADGDNVTFKVVAQPKLGNAEIDVDGVTLRFTPRADVHGEDEIAVEASDGKNKTRAQLPLRVAARNDPPTIDAVTIEMWEDTSADIAVVARDKDGDAVKITLPEKIANVEAVKLSGGMLSVTPKKDYAGPIEIMLTPSDAAGKGAPGRVAIDVKNVNDAPTVKDLVIKAEPGKAVSGVVEAQDVDVGDELTFSLAAPPKQGSVTIDDARSGRFTYTATANAHGEDSFRIRVKDKAGESVAATVGVSIVTSRRPVAQR